MPQLPLELWGAIGHALPTPDLLNLAYASTALHDLLAREVRSRRDEKMRIDFRMIISRGNESYLGPFSGYSGDSRPSKTIGEALDSIVRGVLPASFIKCIQCDVSTNGAEYDAYDWGAAVCAFEDGAVLRANLRDITFLDDAEREKLFQDIAKSDEEAALCVLLTMATGLKRLCTFNNSEPDGVHDFVVKLARAIGEGRVSESKMLPSLDIVHAQAANGEWGIKLSHLAGYAALPSIRTVLGDKVGSHWPFELAPGLPLCRATKFVFRNSCVRIRDVEKWAASCRGPCLMTQNWRWAGDYSDSTDRNRGLPDWDVLRIVGELDLETGGVTTETKRINIELQDEDPDREEMNIDEGVEWPDIS